MVVGNFKEVLTHSEKRGGRTQPEKQLENFMDTLIAKVVIKNATAFKRTYSPPCKMFSPSKYGAYSKLDL